MGAVSAEAAQGNHERRPEEVVGSERHRGRGGQQVAREARTPPQRRRLTNMTSTHFAHEYGKGAWKRERLFSSEENASDAVSNVVSRCFACFTVSSVGHTHPRHGTGMVQGAQCGARRMVHGCARGDVCVARRPAGERAGRPRACAKGGRPAARCAREPAKEHSRALASAIHRICAGMNSDVCTAFTRDNTETT